MDAADLATVLKSTVIAEPIFINDDEQIIITTSTAGASDSTYVVTPTVASSSTPWSGTFTNGDAATVTVENGIITNVA